jgi:signal transduction histidine kinase
VLLEGEATHRFDEQLHELRTGLAGISSAVGLLVQHEAAFDVTERSRLQGMVETELGRLQRLLAQGEEHSLEPLCVHEVLQPLIACRRLAGQDVRLDPSDDWIVADRDLVAEALIALLLNAERHAPEATVSVTVSSRSGSTRITVADDGPGIPPGLRGTLFERGVRDAASPGQGLGLHLARRALRAQGGDLSLDPPCAGGGAVFVVTLPGYSPQACA